MDPCVVCDWGADSVCKIHLLPELDWLNSVLGRHHQASNDRYCLLHDHLAYHGLCLCFVLYHFGAESNRLWHDSKQKVEWSAVKNTLQNTPTSILLRGWYDDRKLRREFIQTG